jgi:hypothetical protein
MFDFDLNDPSLTVEQRKMLVDLIGLADQIRKGHYLNVHFRAFQLANESWQEHIRVNAELGSRKGPGTPPYGALLDEPPAKR